ncbi:hypothetical protein DB346_22155 [Verrucomicrobia bacterium LW23]|nr:hypothetical protein DB346_22155 [Verrucomicrobia bacterium LW23]
MSIPSEAPEPQRRRVLAPATSCRRPVCAGFPDILHPCICTFSVPLFLLLMAFGFVAAPVAHAHVPQATPPPQSPPNQEVQANPEEDGGRPAPSDRRPSSSPQPGDIEIVPPAPPAPPPAPPPSESAPAPMEPLQPADPEEVPPPAPAPEPPSRPRVRPTWVQVREQILRGITSVTLTEDGRIKIIHSDGGGNFERKQIPEDFLEAWGITPIAPATPAPSLPYPTSTPEDAAPPPATGAPSGQTPQRKPAAATEKRPAPLTPALDAPMGLRWGMPREEASAIMTRRPDTTAVSMGAAENKVFFKGGRFADFLVERYELMFSGIGLYHVTVVMDGSRDPVAKFEEVRGVLSDKFGKPGHDYVTFAAPFSRDDTPDNIQNGLREGKVRLLAIWTWQGADSAKAPQYSLRLAYTTTGNITIEYFADAFSVSSEKRRNTKDL